MNVNARTRPGESRSTQPADAADGDVARAAQDFKEKLRSLHFGVRPTDKKVTVDRTDTAWVTTTEKNEIQDVHVALTDAVRPHRPEMTRKYWKEQTDA